MKRAILLVAFGTGIPEARKVFDRIDAQAKEAFPGEEIRWAYTSRAIRARLAERGERMDSPEVALARLMEERYTHVALLSLHVMPGQEFHQLYSNARLFGRMEGGFKQIEVARPLLSSADDMRKLARALLGRTPPGREPRDAVLLIGHGNKRHPADPLYAAMNFIFRELDPNVFVGSVSGYPTVTDLLPRLEAEGIKKVFLAPFMVVAGEHARKDMAGDDPESWKSVLTRNGYDCEAALTGIAEYPEVVEIWLDHLRAVLERME